MPDLDAAASILPIHIEETIQSIARLHAEHRANATQHQRVVDRITSLLSRLVFIAVLTIVVVGWLGLNGFAVSLGYRPLDLPPFSWLSGAASGSGTEDPLQGTSRVAAPQTGRRRWKAAPCACD